MIRIIDVLIHFRMSVQDSGVSGHIRTAETLLRVRYNITPVNIRYISVYLDTSNEIICIFPITPVEHGVKFVLCVTFVCL